MANMDLMDRLLATLRVRIPGVTQEALNLELFNVLDEFFKKTSAWHWETSVPLIALTQDYPIFPPSGSDLVQVLGAEYRGKIVAPTSTDEGSTVQQQGRLVGTSLPPDFDAIFQPAVTTSPGGVFRYSLFFPKYVTLSIPPDENAAQYPFRMMLALTLNYEVLEDEPNEWPLEEWMFGTFHQAWEDGVQARFFSMIAKPWTNPNMAAYHAKRFRNHMAKAKQVSARGYTYNVPNWRFPGFA